MAETPEAEATPKKKGKLKIIIPVVVLVIGLGGGGYFMTAGSAKKAAAGPATTTTTEPGITVPLNSITMNLTDGHVLKVGLSLEFSAKPKDKLLAAAVAAAEAATTPNDGTSTPLAGQDSKALDLANRVLGNSNYATLSDAAGRQAAKDDLAKEIIAAYKGDVLEVYYTGFVMS